MMKQKNYLALSLLLLASAMASAKTVAGSVKAEGKGLAGVVVTDGKSFATTDAQGNYKIEADDKADFISIVTPSGYVASYASGTPEFYKTLNAKNFDFTLYPFGTAKGTYTLFGIGDSQTGPEHDYDRMEHESLPALRQLGQQYLDRNTPVAAIILGDIADDRPDTYPRFKNDLKTLPFPVYTIIGNHDHYQFMTDDHESSVFYRQFFGPTYYAVNIGNDYYIMLDNIVYKARQRYDEAIPREQLDWVKAYTKYIPKGSRVFVSMHCPAYIYNHKRKLKGSDELMDILSAYDVKILSGHTHIQSNLQLRPNVMEHMIGALCGSWWLWDWKYCKDGTPMGWQVFESTPKQISWYYQSIGHPADYQMQAFPVGTFPGHEKELCVKIWNYDAKWRVEWFEDGKRRGEMKHFAAADPLYTSYLNRHYATGNKQVGGYRRPVVNEYAFFSAVPSANAKQIAVKATDRFGRVYTEKVDL